MLPGCILAPVRAPRCEDVPGHEAPRAAVAARSPRPRAGAEITTSARQGFAPDLQASSSADESAQRFYFYFTPRAITYPS